MMNRKLAASIAAVLAAAAMSASAATAPSSSSQGLASQYASWAGSADNARSLVTGMRSGTSVVLVTQGADNRRSLAGFTPSHAMSEGEISSALANARRSLARLGIQQPTAEQIQAALIGGEIESRGEMVKVQGQVRSGSVALR